MRLLTKIFVGGMLFSCGANQSSQLSQVPTQQGLIQAMSGKCTSSVNLNENAALLRKMRSDSNGSVKWQPISNEVHHINTGTGSYVAQLAMGTGQVAMPLFRIYFAPMQVWTPVQTLAVDSNICQGQQPVVVITPIVTPGPITVFPWSPRTCSESDLGSRATCANFMGTDPERGNIEAKGSCHQDSTRAFQLLSDKGCVVRCPQALLHWGSGRIEGLPIFNGSTTYFVQRDGREWVQVTLASHQPNANVTGQLCQ